MCSALGPRRRENIYEASPMRTRGEWHGSDGRSNQQISPSPADTAALKPTLPPIPSKLRRCTSGVATANRGVLDQASSYLHEVAELQRQHHSVNAVASAIELYKPSPPITAKLSRAGPLIVPATTVGCHEPWPMGTFTSEHSLPGQFADVQSGRSAYHRPKASSSPNLVHRYFDRDTVTQLPSMRLSAAADSPNHQLVKKPETRSLNKVCCDRQASKSPEGSNLGKDCSLSKVCSDREASKSPDASNVGKDNSQSKPWKRTQSSSGAPRAQPTAWDYSSGWDIATDNDDDLELLVCCSTALPV